NRQTIVCPDNGLITWPLHRCGALVAHEITWRPRAFSSTFHGRDILAPVAAMLAAGRSIQTIARNRIRDPVLLDVQPARPQDGIGRIIHIDPFGNATTNIVYDSSGPPKTRQSVRVKGRQLGPVRRTYSDVSVGKPLALIGSSGLLEIAMRK